MATRNPLEKIEVLDSIEKDIITCLQSAGQVLQELGKDKSSLKSVENHTSQFLKSLNQVETKLTEQVNYLTQVSTGQPHEGSGYASAKVLQMAWHRIHHVKSRVRELEESKQKYLQNQVRGTQMQGRQLGVVGTQNGVNVTNTGAPTGQQALNTTPQQQNHSGPNSTQALNQ
uniref:Mediator of RNA polymerase II transcription subunit 11 n=1 Tax=Culicoides sonorensis TaxID=179676 RepID=A0A336MQI1_CULSO